MTTKQLYGELQKMITPKEFDQMYNFFRRKYFDNIPAIDCFLGNPIDYELDEDCDGHFIVQQNPDYNEEDDELIHGPGYAKRLELEDSGIGCEWGTPSWTDPLNHPKLYIIVNHNLRNDPMRLIGTLFHELAHYWCWYCGYGYHDGERDYENKLKELGIPSNWDHSFNKKDGIWEDSFDYSKMKPFYDDYKINAGQK